MVFLFSLSWFNDYWLLSRLFFSSSIIWKRTVDQTIAEQFCWAMVGWTAVWTLSLRWRLAFNEWDKQTHCRWSVYRTAFHVWMCECARCLWFVNGKIHDLSMADGRCANGSRNLVYIYENFFEYVWFEIWWRWWWIARILEQILLGL